MNILSGLTLLICLFYAGVSEADMWMPIEFEPMTVIDCGD